MKRILYIEDNKLQIATFLFAARGKYDVRSETQGACTLQRIALDSPDIVVIDWELSISQVDPDPKNHDGIVIGKAVRRAYPDLPIVVLTDWPREDVEEHINGEFTYVSKRKEWEEVFKEIAQILGE